jgi:hypothetical protein
MAPIAGLPASGEAVISEPISAALIPCSAGKYSEFVNLHLKIECGVGLPDGNSIAYQQNSYTAKQRRCPGKQGSSFAKQGHAMSACGAVRTKHRGGNLLRLVPEADITRGPCAIRAIHLELARSPGRRVRSGLLLKKRLDLIGHIRCYLRCYARTSSAWVCRGSPISEEHVS